MTETRFRSALFIWSGWLLVSLFLQAGPEALRNQFDSVLQMTSAIGLELPQMLMAAGTDPGANQADSNPGDAIARIQAENRVLIKLVAELKTENSQLKQAVPLPAVTDSAPLVKFDLVSARIIGQRGDVVSESLQLLTALGKDQAIIAGDLVLSGTGLLIDQGIGQQLTPDQLVTAGRGLYGRTQHVGAMSSLIQPMTDPTFRMAVRIVRRSPLGPIEGPQGILAGTGTRCRLDEVAATEAVAAGDEVYTDRLVSPGGEPVYCGRVISATAGPGDNHWAIEVEPMHAPGSCPPRVFILRAQLNPERNAEATEN